MKKALSIVKDIKNRGLSILNTHIRGGFYLGYKNLHYLYPEFFKTNLSELQVKQLFKRCVRTVYIEPFSFCNRSCYFCPNSLVDRRTNNVFMDKELFTYIIKSLAEIEFKGKIFLHRYNEPFASDGIFDYIAIARELLPYSKLKLFSNGDYLDNKKLNRLAQLGVNELQVTMYLKDYTISNSSDEGDKLCKEFIKQKGLVIEKTIISENSLKFDCYLSHINNMRIMINNKNMNNCLSRGGVIESKQNKLKRNTACFEPFYKFDIDYEGRALMCCNIHSNVDKHKNYKTDKIVVGEKSIFDIYKSQSVVNWRKTLANNIEDYDICEYCTMNSEELQEPLNNLEIESYKKYMLKVSS
jgi:hypothetical protein